MSDNLSFQDLYADSVACIGKSDKISEATKAKIRMLQEQKDKILSVNATKCSESRGRVVKEDDGDVRNCFERDMGRIIYSQAFRRLKHKTQVFFNPANDHICSRLEHVLYVDYIASTIGSALNLNVDLRVEFYSNHHCMLLPQMGYQLPEEQQGKLRLIHRSYMQL